MMTLIDQLERDRFIGETGRNFSVIAPAGVGKTRAITERVAKLAAGDANRAEPLLPKLAVVTYTRAAAEEMRQRARRAVGAQSEDPAALAGFNQAFFGTIHSFCVELLRTYGPLAGLPASFQVTTELDVLWARYLETKHSLLDFMPGSAREAFAQYASLEPVLDQAKRLNPDTVELGELSDPPDLFMDTLLNFEAADRRTARTVEEGKRLARTWWTTISEGEPAELPDYQKGGAQFRELWEQTFGLLRDWLAEASLHLMTAVARDFRAYRISVGQIIYDDMISLAEALSVHPTLGREIYRQDRFIVLDEAQDTDPRQFAVLLRVAGAHVVRRGDAIEILHEPPAGRFCMVGDPQQSIYSDRANTATYQSVHDQLCQTGGALTFQVTMRCDEKVVATVNRFFPEILQRRAGSAQVPFVRLEKRPWAGKGEVFRLALPAPDFAGRENEGIRATTMVQALMSTLRELGPTDLGAEDWHEIALLCPRNNWLEQIGRAAEEAGFAVQTYRSKDDFHEQPALAWLAALLHVLLHPDDPFEVAGVLREVFGVSDDAMARYVEEGHERYRTHPLSLLAEIHGSGELPDALRRLQGWVDDLPQRPVKEVVERLVREAELPARLAGLPEAEAERQALDRLRQRAVAAEQMGEDLAAFAASLAAESQPGESIEEPRPGHLQLLTGYKAKGLEWRVVLVPFVFRPVRYPASSYPRLLRNAAGLLAPVYDSSHAKQYRELNDLEERRQAEEMERLLYVIATRARNRLVFVDDEAYWKPRPTSFAQHLRICEGQPNRAAWQTLPPFQSFAPETLPELAPGSPALLPVALAPPAADTRKKAAARSERFVRRVLPSSLARHEVLHDEADLLAQPVFPELQAMQQGADYGNWWHESMETLPFSRPEGWEAHLAARRELCPQPERGAEEQQRFLASPAAAWLANGHKRFRAEVPFLWRQNDQRALDGFIDLLIFDEAAGVWHVLDWKTDALPDGEGSDALKRAYRPQINAYVQAVADAFGGPAQGWLYSTRAGELVEL